jgi:N-acetylglucosamine malate deacetylase 1
LIPAVFHPPICDDMAIFYDAKTLAKVASVVRQSNPTIVLTHAPSDYMEDHETTCRLAVSGTFVKSMPNFQTIPSIASVSGPVAIYHAQPHGNQTPLGGTVHPTTFVNISSVLDRKVEMLKCHASQEGWLDETQKMSSYVASMKAAAAEMGQQSKRFQAAEGFRKHLHLGFCDRDFHPLKDALQQDVLDV